jgi:hypothetical protein
MDTQRLYQLLERYAARTASPAEQQELFSLIDTAPEAELKAALSAIQEATLPDPAPDPARWQPVFDRILATARTLESADEVGGGKGNPPHLPLGPYCRRGHRPPGHRRLALE